MTSLVGIDDYIDNGVKTSICVMLVLLVIVVLQGCAFFPQKPPQEELLTTPITGRVTMQYGSERDTAAFRFAEYHDRTVIDITGNLGLGRAQISIFQETVDIRTSTGSVARLDRHGEVFVDTLGVALPVDSFIFWIHGVPNPNIDFERTGQMSATQSTFLQSGFEIRASNFTVANEKAKRRVEIQPRHQLNSGTALLTLSYDVNES